MFSFRFKVIIKVDIIDRQQKSSSISSIHSEFGVTSFSLASSTIDWDESGKSLFLANRYSSSNNYSFYLGRSFKILVRIVLVWSTVICINALPETKLRYSWLLSLRPKKKCCKSMGSGKARWGLYKAIKTIPRPCQVIHCLIVWIL